LVSPELLVNSSFDFVSGLVALLVSYYAFRANRIVQNSTLRSVSIGFMLLGVGLLLQGFTNAALGLTSDQTAHAILDISGLIYLIIQPVAYFVIAIGYALGAYRNNSQSPTVPAIVLATALQARVALTPAGFLAYSGSELLVLIFLGFVVFQGLLIYSRSKNRFSLLILVAFALLLVAHLITLGGLVVLSQRVLAFASGVQFCGFVSLLVFLVRSGRNG
jgi:hypothetical protein